MSLRTDGRSWAKAIKRRSSRGCETCAWLATHPRAAEFHAGIIDEMRRNGERPPIARVHDELRRRFGLQIEYGGMRNHWVHVLRDVTRA